MKEAEVLATAAPDAAEMLFSSAVNSFTTGIALLSLLSVYGLVVYGCKRVRRQRKQDSSPFCVLDSILLGRARVYYLQTPAGPALALISSHGVTLTCVGTEAQEVPDRQTRQTVPSQESQEQCLFGEYCNE